MARSQHSMNVPSGRASPSFSVFRQTACLLFGTKAEFYSPLGPGSWPREQHLLQVPVLSTMEGAQQWTRSPQDHQPTSWVSHRAVQSWTEQQWLTKGPLHSYPVPLSYLGPRTLPAPKMCTAEPLSLHLAPSTSSLVAIETSGCTQDKAWEDAPTDSNLQTHYAA